MGYWDNILKFHQSVNEDNPIAEEAIKSIKFLRAFFEKRGCENLPPDHPLHPRLGVGAQSNYLWLKQFTKKIQKASSLSEFDQIAKRLINPKTFLTAYFEIEISLKLHLEGLNVYFVNVDAKHNPDMKIKVDNKLTNIEVSSLNPPDQETRFQTFLDHILHLHMSLEVVLGGYVNRIPSPKEMEKIFDQLKESINKSKDAHKVEKLNYEGVVTIYIAPNDLANQIPDDCRGRFHFFGPPERKPIQKQIQQKIEYKRKQLFRGNQPGILFLYTLLINRKDVFKLFKTDMDDITAVLTSYPKLLGLVLIVPYNEIGTVSMEMLETLKPEYKKNKILLECEAGKYQYESIIIWKNLHSKDEFPDEVINAIKDYSENLSNLEPLSLNE